MPFELVPYVALAVLHSQLCCVRTQRVYSRNSLVAELVELRGSFDPFVLASQHLRVFSAVFPSLCCVPWNAAAVPDCDSHFP